MGLSATGICDCGNGFLLRVHACAMEGMGAVGVQLSVGDGAVVNWNFDIDSTLYDGRVSDLYRTREVERSARDYFRVHHTIRAVNSALRLALHVCSYVTGCND